MIQVRRPDDGESSDDRSGPDHCSLLDEYWGALGGESAADLRQRLIDRYRPDESIAEDLGVLDLLHQARCVAGADGEASQLPAAWLSESFAMEAPSPPGGTGAGVAPPGTEGGAAADQPRRIGKYMVVEKLDSGGQAQVFRVIHPGLAKEFALKLARRPMATEEQAGRDALLEEGRRLAQCDHPNLVRVHDLDVHDGRRFVVMEYVKGLTLRQFVARHRPGPRRAARLVIELAGAVAYLHDRGIVHQDIKPQNVLIDERGRPRLIDLGLARQNHAWCDDADEWIGGTAGYMSPEQALGRGDLIGPRTDVFGLGGVLYHLLTGRALYVGSSPASTRRLARAADYAPVRQLNPRLPRSLERICDKALAADPERRYGTTHELGRVLRRYLERRWMVVGTLALVALVSVALFVRRRGTEPNPSESAIGLPSASAAKAPAPLEVLEFGGEHYRKRDGQGEDVFGRIGYSSTALSLKVTELR